MGNHSFDTKDPLGKWFDLQEDYQDYLSDDTSSRKATHLATTCWHLIDWLFTHYVALNGPIAGFATLTDYREDLYPRCPNLKLMHDIANGSKHAELSRPKSNIKDTNKKMGGFGAGFSRKDFDVSRLEIHMEDGSIIDFYDVAEDVVTFWNNYFNNVLGIYPSKDRD